MASGIVPNDDRTSSVLNEKHDEDHYFPQFSLLPWELRHQIWTCALQRRRMIRVDLAVAEPNTLTEQEAKETKYGRSTLYVNGFRVLSKLLRVNSEARKAALEFYRVHLPCVLVSLESEKPPMQFGTLLFNPEHDILCFGRIASFAAFFSALVARDSRRVGLCNIAIYLDLASFALEDADDPSEYEKPAFREAVGHIRELYLIAETSSYRQRYVEDLYNDPPSLVGPPISHALYPLMSSVPAFDLLPRDPRPVGSDLARLPLGNGGDLPRQIAQRVAWARTWGLDVAGVDARVLFVYRDANPCFPVEASPFYEGADADRLRAGGVSRMLYEPPLPSMPTIVLVPERPPPGLPGRRPDANLAVGFWVFPLDAFAEANQVAASPHADGYVDVWDVSRHWPALALAHIPTSPSRTAAV